MSNLITKHIVSFSGGMGSFAEAKSCVDKYGKENVILLFSDTKTEDTDLYRFMDEVVAFLQCELIVLADGRTIWELFEDSKFVGNSKMDLCSQKLKRNLMIDWIFKNFGIKQKVYLKDENGNPLTTKTGRHKYQTQWMPDPNRPVEIHLGIDFSEHHRLTRCQERMAPWIYRSTLVEEGRIVQKDFSEQFGIKRPFLYTMGFAHNNCFHGDEKFITPKGNKSFSETVGQSVRVLGVRGNWKDATIQHFGKQQIYKLHLKKGNRTKVIKTTKDHRWFLKQGYECATSSLPEGSLLKSMHQKHILDECWSVHKVEETNEITDVYCAVVPDGHAFTLESNIFTGNCGAFCVKAGLGQFKMLYEKLPERYKYHEEKEEHLRHTCNTKPFLKKVIKGETHYLYMKDYREQYLETGKSEEDKFDIGGCACALPLD